MRDNDRCNNCTIVKIIKDQSKEIGAKKATKETINRQEIKTDTTEMTYFITRKRMKKENSRIFLNSGVSVEFGYLAEYPRIQ